MLALVDPVTRYMPDFGMDERMQAHHEWRQGGAPHMALPAARRSLATRIEESRRRELHHKNDECCSCRRRRLTAAGDDESGAKQDTVEPPSVLSATVDTVFRFFNQRLGEANATTGRWQW